MSLLLSILFIQGSIADSIVSTADTPLVNILFKGIDQQRNVCQFEYNRKTINVGNRTKVVEGFVRIEVSVINKTHDALRCFASITYNPVETKIVERNDGSFSRFMYVKKVLKPAVLLHPGEMVQVDVSSIQPVVGSVEVARALSAVSSPPPTKEQPFSVQEDTVPPIQSVVFQKQKQGFWQWLVSLFKRVK